MFFTSVHNTFGEHILGPEDPIRRDSEQMRKFLLDTRDDAISGSTLDEYNITEDSPAAPLVKEGQTLPLVSNSSLAPTLLYDLPLPTSHPCKDFAVPPPPTDKKRTGPRRKFLWATRPCRLLKDCYFAVVIFRQEERFKHYCFLSEFVAIASELRFH